MTIIIDESRIPNGIEHKLYFSRDDDYLSLAPFSEAIGMVSDKTLGAKY
jgi:hypothetical protein